MNFLAAEEAAMFDAHTDGIRPEHVALSKSDGRWEGRVGVAEHLGSNTFFMSMSRNSIQPSRYVLTEKDLIVNLSSNGIVPCLSLSLSNASVLMEACQSSSFGNAAMLGFSGSSSGADTTSGGQEQTVDVNNILALDKDLILLITSQ